MKKALKLIGIIALVAVIGFWAVSCGGDDDSGGGGNAIAGNTITSGAEVVYDTSIEDITEAKKANNFSFLHYWGDNNHTGDFKPLSYFLDGSPSVTVNDNKVTIILGTPKSNFLVNFSDVSELSEGITVNPSNFKFCEFPGFCTSDGEYDLNCKDDNHIFGSADLLYVDRDVTMKGTEMEGTDHITTYNVSLKKGWNYIISLLDENKYNHTNTSSTTLPSGYKWKVFKRNQGWH